MSKKKRKKKKKNKKKSTYVTTYAKKKKTVTIHGYKPAVIKKVTQKPIERVSIDLDLKLMKQVCTAPRAAFQTLQFYPVTPTVRNTPDGTLIHIDNGSKILGVAHLDSYGEKYKHFDMVAGTRIYNASLDDRLGAYVLYHLANLFKIDILLTEGEEQGSSTALHFDPPREYNWMFEFDRGGKDVVLYDYEDKETEELMESYGYDVGMGSFSDITFLEHLGCKGFNIGTGYHDYHEKYAYVKIRELKKNIRRFIQFIKDNQEIHYPHTPAPIYQGGYEHHHHGYGWDGYPYSKGTGATADTKFDWEGYGQEPEDETRELTEYQKSNIHLNSEWICAWCGERTPEDCLGTGKCEGCADNMHNDVFYFDTGYCETCYIATYFSKEDQAAYYNGTLDINYPKKDG